MSIDIARYVAKHSHNSIIPLPMSSREKSTTAVTPPEAPLGAKTSALMTGKPAINVMAIETIRVGEFPNLLWVQVHTDEGRVGLGETFYGPAAAERIARTCTSAAPPGAISDSPLCRRPIRLSVVCGSVEL
jgi:hypothetical protein